MRRCCSITAAFSALACPWLSQSPQFGQRSVDRLAVELLGVRESIEQVLIAGNSATIIQRSRTFAIQTSEAGAFGRTQDVFENHVNFPAVAEVVFVQEL